MFWLSVAKWFGTLCGIAGATMIALNLGVVVYGFALFFVSSVLWGVVGLIQREPSLVVLQSVFTVVNVLGLWRWAV